MPSHKTVDARDNCVDRQISFCSRIRGHQREVPVGAATCSRDRYSRTKMGDRSFLAIGPCISQIIALGMT